MNARREAAMRRNITRGVKLMRHAANLAEMAGDNEPEVSVEYLLIAAEDLQRRLARYGQPKNKRGHFA